MRTIVALISTLGLLLFGSAFVLSFINPGFVESVGRSVVRLEVERRVGEKLGSIEGSKIVSITERICGRNAAEILEIKQKLADGLPQKVAAVAAEMRNLDCPCRKAIERSMTSVFEGRVNDLAHMNERLMLLIRTKHVEVAESLTREFRIFSGANALIFALLGFTLAFRRRATLQLALPTLVLLGASSLVAYLYIFKQDWLHTVVFAEYVGLGYFAYLAAAVAFLADIVFNRARVSTRIVNVSLNLVGAVAKAVPC
jgi:ABC-type multidrug transport system fused ATPase/permease subunit